MAVVPYLCNEPRTTETRLTQRAPEPRQRTPGQVVGVCAFSSTFRGLRLVPSKWRGPAGQYPAESMRDITQAVGQKERVETDE